MSRPEERVLDTPFLRLQHGASESLGKRSWQKQPPSPRHTSPRYDALLSLSKTLAGHRTTGELFEGLADHLHSIVPFDYLALFLHDDATQEMRLVVLEATDIVVPFVSRPVAETGRRQPFGKRGSEPSSPSRKKVRCRPCSVDEATRDKIRTTRPSIEQATVRWRSTSRDRRIQECLWASGGATTQGRRFVWS
jgi:hypothetical protein